MSSVVYVGSFYDDVGMFFIDSLGSNAPRLQADRGQVHDVLA